MAGDDAAQGSEAWQVSCDDYVARHPPRYDVGFDRFSTYVAARDDTRLAVDVHLPKGQRRQDRLPTIINFTPYFRRFKLKDGHPPALDPSPNTGKYRDYFVPHGYAVVVVDVRGTGASFGTRNAFRSPVERDDCRDVVDWIIAQPWSDERVGATGVSYVGATADFLGTTGHPAVKAVCPTFSVWDTYSDQYYPGGLYCKKLAPNYARVVEALDQDNRRLYTENEGLGGMLDPPECFDGPAPVDEDGDERLLRAAVAQHAANIDLEDFIRQFEFRDSGLSYDPDFTSALIGPYGYAHDVRPEVAYFSVSGWYDGNGFANAAVKRFRSLARDHHYLLLGPWDHGARRHVSPFRTRAAPSFDLLGECLRFFDQHLKGADAGLDAERRVHYYTLVEERWKAADTWPLPGAVPTPWYFAPSRTLQTETPAPAAAFDEYEADYGCSSGRHTRYERLVAHHVENYYDDWHGKDARMLTFTSPALVRDTEVTGHPVVTLHVESSARDGSYFVYLEDVDPDGTCRYVTEGMLRALHRKVAEAPSNDRAVGPYHSLRREDAAFLEPGEVAELCIALFPISWLFRQGHRVRVAVAAADVEHYVRIPDGSPPRLKIYRGGAHASRIELPVIP